MTRGTILFICTQCKKVFLAPDIEYGAMFFSVPMPCERCGSIRTLPMKLDFFVDSINPDKPLERQLRDYAVYKDIWGKQGSNSYMGQDTPDEQYRIGMEYLDDSFHGSDVAFYWLMKAAKRGHVQAQYQVGRLLRHRPPVPKYLQNPPFCYTEGTAYQWMAQAAEQGLPEAMCGLGNMYCVGDVIEKNPEKAFAWHLKAAMSGCAASEYAIACLYEQGQGVEQNTFKALRWCWKAALHGYAEAQLRLGIVYESTGKKRYFHTAATFYQQAAQQQSIEAWKHLAALYEAGKGEQNLQKAWECYVNAWEAGDENAYQEAKRLVDEGLANPDASTLMAWYRKCIERGHKEVWYDLGKIYHEGRGVERNLQEARQCYLFAARTSHVPEAQFALGRMYEEGEGIQPDLQKAIRWYKEAANQGHTEAQVVCRRLKVYEPREGFDTWQQLALLYEVGKGEQNLQKLWECYLNAWEAGNENIYQEAKRLLDEGWVKLDASTLMEWYRKCITRGHREAWYDLGKIYHEGRGVERNLQEARQCYLFAARTSHVPEAQFALGRMYEQGEGIQPDLQEAVRWYKEAAKQGHTEAQAACWRLEDGND